MEYFAQYGLYLAQTVTWAIALIAILIVFFSLVQSSKQSDKERFRIINLNERYQKVRQKVERAILGKTELKSAMKADKKKQKDEKDNVKQRSFVIEFTGDIKASSVELLRHEVSAVLSVAKSTDEVIVILESPGGLVPHYGYAAAQLQRIREQRIPLTVCVDRVAASGGYLMACVANEILCAPFAYVGSIGVVAQLPNFNRFLKKHDVDYEMVTAGNYKRTLTVFGENTDADRKKFKQDLEMIHDLFKHHVNEYRPQCDMATVGTGEYWPGNKAIDLKLVDRLMTSDDYLMKQVQERAVYKVEYKAKATVMQKMSKAMHAMISLFNQQQQFPL